jgi:hypothetical protein
MSGIWTVKFNYVPVEKPAGPPALLEGNPFSFIFGDRLERDDEKTVNEEKEAVIIRQWFWLFEGRRAGYVPYNPLDPDDFRSVAIVRPDEVEPPFKFHLFDPEISVEVFAENCVRKAVRWETNAAYLFALAWVESGAQWPAGKVTSPPAKQGESTVGTYQVLPATWKTFVEKLGVELRIVADDIGFPEAQVTFAASQSSDAMAELKNLTGSPPRYVDLFLAHLLTIKGCASLLDAAPAAANQRIDALLQQIAIAPERVAYLFSAKRHLVTDPQGQVTTVATFLQNCIAELDRGFEHVKAVALEMIPQEDTDSSSAATPGGTGSAWIGILSEEFESSGNSGAIGWDKAGGWSYGKYQIASNKGNMAKFLQWLVGRFDKLKQVLEEAGGDAAARAGAPRFQDAWRSLKTNPDFVPAQYGFIKESHYDVMVKRLASVLDVDQASFAIQNVVWSVAVQHGPYSDIIKKCVDAVGSADDARLINAIYDERSKVDLYFSTQPEDIKDNLRKRFIRERKAALAML